jgi:hypothetical protein
MPSNVTCRQEIAIGEKGWAFTRKAQKSVVEKNNLFGLVKCTSILVHLSANYFEHGLNGLKGEVIQA